MVKTRSSAKARQDVMTNIDITKNSEIQSELSKNESGGASNLLTLPSKKRETKIVKEKKEKAKFLSKAQRKRSETIVDKNKKNDSDLASLIESLTRVQTLLHEVAHLPGKSAVQTKGRKRNELNSEQPVQKVAAETDEKFSSTAGAKMRLILRLPKMDNSEKLKKKK